MAREGRGERRVGEGREGKGGERRKGEGRKEGKGGEGLRHNCWGMEAPVSAPG